MHLVHSNQNYHKLNYSGHRSSSKRTKLEITKEFKFVSSFVQYHLITFCAVDRDQCPVMQHTATTLLTYIKSNILQYASTHNIDDFTTLFCSKYNQNIHYYNTDYFSIQTVHN